MSGMWRCHAVGLLKVLIARDWRARGEAVKPEKVYHYRGEIERGDHGHWTEGYSYNSASGLVTYPWLTRAQCRKAAARDGYRAVFYRNGQPEDRPNDRPNRDLPDDLFIVICRDDKIGQFKGPYTLATRRVFTSRLEATEYAQTCAPSRQPIVVSGRFSTLRIPANTEFARGTDSQKQPNSQSL